MIVQLSTYANIERQSTSVDRAEIKSAIVSTFAFSLSVMFAIRKTFKKKWKNGPLISSMNTKSATYLCGAHAKNAWDIVRTGTSSSTAVLYSRLVLERNSAPAAWCFSAALGTMSNSGSNDLKHLRANLPVALALVGTEQCNSRSILTVKLVASK